MSKPAPSQSTATPTQDRATNVPPIPITQVKSQSRAIVIGILTIPLAGIGLLVLASILLTKNRTGPCPHCGDPIRLRDGERRLHEACGDWVERQGQLLYAEA